MNKTIMQKITPFLWFEHDAEEAAKFYTSIFKNSKIIDITHYGKSAAETSGRPKGTVMSVTFELEGQLFMALYGGPVFKFSPAISFFEFLPSSVEQRAVILHTHPRLPYCKFCFHKGMNCTEVIICFLT